MSVQIDPKGQEPSLFTYITVASGLRREAYRKKVISGIALDL